MPESDLFRPRLAEMINLRHPLVVLASRLPRAQIEAALAPRFARQAREMICSAPPCRWPALAWPPPAALVFPCAR